MQVTWTASLPLEVLRRTVPCRDDVGHLLAAPARQRLPVYVLVVGVEGAGHHALETVWRNLAQQYDLHMTGYSPGLHSFNKPHNVSRAYQFSSIELARHRRTFQRFLARDDILDKRLVIDSRNSYPEGYGVGNLAHPDLLFLGLLDGDLIDLRVLVLYRDPTACVLSAVRRFQVERFEYKNYQWQARAVEESLAMIHNAIPLLPCGKVAVYGYEALMAQPAMHARSLADLIGVKRPHLLEAMRDLRPSAYSSALPSDEQLAATQADLQAFFSAREHLWPLLTQAKPLPPVRTRRAALLPRLLPAKPPSRGERDVLPDRFLRLDWPLHLGFNNMRFIMEMGMAMARALRRRLLLPTHLRVRGCQSSAQCLAAGCELRGGDNGVWCPLGLFLDQTAWQRAGALLEGEQAGANLTEAHMADAFAPVYNKSTLCLEDWPQTDGGQAPAVVYRYHLGCEFAYMKLQEVRRATAAPVLRFGDLFASEVQVLHLMGAPHRIGQAPFLWPSRQAALAAEAHWHTGLRYRTEVDLAAEAAMAELLARGGSASFVCVHLRRGDFVAAGWLGHASDMEQAARSIEAVRQSDEEALYLATDETNRTQLGRLTRSRSAGGLGALRWDDLRDAVMQTLEAQSLDAGRIAAAAPREATAMDPGVLLAMAALEDLVGLVEQSLCARARTFLGSECSSFTGQIWNLRRRFNVDQRRRLVGVIATP
jgi:hypothetical protein